LFKGRCCRQQKHPIIISLLCSCAPYLKSGWNNIHKSVYNSVWAQSCFTDSGLYSDHRNLAQILIGDPVTCMSSFNDVHQTHLRRQETKKQNTSKYGRILFAMSLATYRAGYLSEESTLINLIHIPSHF
jgi:hypothetical protein